MKRKDYAFWRQFNEKPSWAAQLGCPVGLPSWAAHLHSNAFASQGASKVLVEQKLKSSEGFGKGRKVHMTFGQLVQQLHKGNNSLYLTTQEVIHMHMLLHHPSNVCFFQ